MVLDWNKGVKIYYQRRQTKKVCLFYVLFFRTSANQSANSIRNLILYIAYGSFFTLYKEINNMWQQDVYKLVTNQIDYSAMENYELINNTDGNQYEFHVGKYLAKIEYIKTNNGEIYLTHTEVPVALEGQGIGSRLVEKVLEDIEKNGLRLIPLCPFVAGYIKKHPDWRRLVMKGFNV